MTKFCLTEETWWNGVVGRWPEIIVFSVFELIAWSG